MGVREREREVLVRGGGSENTGVRDKEVTYRSERQAYVQKKNKRSFLATHRIIRESYKKGYKFHASVINRGHHVIKRGTCISIK